MNIIDRLKEMQGAKNDPTCSVDEFCERVKAFADAMHNATPALLKVAEAAQKSLDQLSYILEVAHNEQHDEVLYPNMLAECATRREELRKALYELEAQ